MGRKGFTLIELLASIVILGIISGLVVYGFNNTVDSTKDKTEEVFVNTIKDAIAIYLDSNARSLSFTKMTGCDFSKSHSLDKISIYNANITFDNVINSDYKPITASEIVNPSNEEAVCNKNFAVTIYRDDDFVYYYRFEKSALGCLKDSSGIITNLPSGLPEGCI